MVVMPLDISWLVLVFEEPLREICAKNIIQHIIFPVVPFFMRLLIQDAPLIGDAIVKYDFEIDAYDSTKSVV